MSTRVTDMLGRYLVDGDLVLQPHPWPLPSLPDEVFGLRQGASAGYFQGTVGAVTLISGRLADVS